MNTGLLRRTPTLSDLERLYYELATRGAPAVGRRRAWPYAPRTTEELLGLAGEMLRFDARMLSILVQFLLAHWESLNPSRVRQVMARMRWPQALCVALAFAKQAATEREFLLWADYVSKDWPRIRPAEQFFFDAPKAGTRMAKRRLGHNLKPYNDWGFVGRERPVVDPVTKRTVGRLDAPTRRRVAQSLAQRPDGFSLADYLHAIDYSVSRQQALADLRSLKGVQSSGHGRGARWEAAS